MEYTELINARYSCKKFDGKQIGSAQLDAILAAGKAAPTAKNLQGQKIYVVQSAEGLAKIDAMTPCRYNAPTVLVVAYDKNNMFTYPGGKFTSAAEDGAIVATHMMLGAKNTGVDSCWVNFFDPEKASSVLGLPENEQIVMLLDLGFPAEGAAPLPTHFNRKDVAQTVRYL